MTRHLWFPASCAALALVISAASLSAQAGDAPPPAWRSGWCGLRLTDDLFAAAKEMNVTALLTHGPQDKMQAFVALAKKNGIEAYYWLAPTPDSPEAKQLVQVMDEKDNARLAEINADKDPLKHGYQHGGEPVPGTHEVLTTPILCFHRPETVAWCQKKITDMFEACPDLTGVAFDYFGYQNYRCCYCPKSKELLAEFQKAHPDLPPEKALVKFSLDSLVTFNNDLSAFVRKLKPGAKIATHVYPTFLPEPLYGNRLDVDYCCQTVAWFFPPYWTQERITRYTQVVVNEQAKYFAHAQGIPFIGVYTGRPYCDKSPERFAEELETAWAATPSRAFSTCSFDEFVKHPELRAAFLKVAGK